MDIPSGFTGSARDSLYSLLEMMENSFFYSFMSKILSKSKMIFPSFSMVQQ
jgi:hypothetical protein